MVQQQSYGIVAEMISADGYHFLKVRIDSVLLSMQNINRVVQYSPPPPTKETICDSIMKSSML